MRPVGSGSPHHLFMETLKSELGLEIQHVPYKGTPAAMTDLLTGQVQVMFADATLAAPNILAGKLTGLGTSAATQTTPALGRPSGGGDRPRLRLESLAGHRRAGRNAGGRHRPSYPPRYRRFGPLPTSRSSSTGSRWSLPRANTPAEFAAVIRAEQPRWAKAVKDSGAKVD